jgi:hypothetical protein
VLWRIEGDHIFEDQDADILKPSSSERWARRRGGKREGLVHAVLRRLLDI